MRFTCSYACAAGSGYRSLGPEPLWPKKVIGGVFDPGLWEVYLGLRNGPHVAGRLPEWRLDVVLSVVVLIMSELAMSAENRSNGDQSCPIS